MIDRSPNKAWQVRDDFTLMKPVVSVTTKRRGGSFATSEGDWTQLILAKTSGAVLGLRKTNWPIGDRGVLSNNPRSNCGRHISAPAPFSFF